MAPASGRKVRRRGRGDAPVAASADAAAVAAPATPSRKKRRVTKAPPVVEAEEPPAEPAVEAEAVERPDKDEQAAAGAASGGDSSSSSDEAAEEESDEDHPEPSSAAAASAAAAAADAPPPRTSAKGKGKAVKTSAATEADDGAAGGNGVLTNQKFDELALSKPTATALASLGFTHMTEVQARSLPHGLAGRDVLGAARTGSGKTLAFVIPIVELLHRVKWTNRHGTGAVIIAPTRELAMQIYGVVRDVCASHHSQTHGVIMGGANRRTEADALARGVSIVVATPGRLLDHLQNTRGFVTKNLQMLVIDEADRCLEVGFEEEMVQIIKKLPLTRQTMLFSATQTTKVEDLVRVSFKNKPVYVGVDDRRVTATVGGLEQGYVVVPSERRFLLLFTFLKKNLGKKKIIVFMSSCSAVKFYAELLNFVDIPVMDLHGRQKQTKRTSTFYEFSKADSAVLICTDVAARGLDIPAVDWIVQFDPPDDPRDYIHRVGRTARGVAGKGRALLFLLPSELGFLKFLRAARVPVSEYEFAATKVAKVQPQLEKLVTTNYYLNKSASEAYRSYLQSYASHSLKEIFNVHALGLAEVAASFCFTSPPRVNLNLMGSGRGDKVRRRGGVAALATGPASRQTGSRRWLRPQRAVRDTPFRPATRMASGQRGTRGSLTGRVTCVRVQETCMLLHPDWTCPSAHL